MQPRTLGSQTSEAHLLEMLEPESPTYARPESASRNQRLRRFRRSSGLRGHGTAKGRHRPDPRNSGEHGLEGRRPSSGTAASYAGDNSGNPASSLNLGFLIRKMGHGRGPSLQSRNDVLKATHVSISVFGGSGSSVHKSSQVCPDPPESWPDVDLLCRPLSHP